MMSFAGLGDALGVGDAPEAGDPVGVGAMLGVVVTGEVEGLASGEFEPVTLGWVQAAKSSTNAATRAAGTARLLTRLSRRIG